LLNLIYELDLVPELFAPKKGGIKPPISSFNYDDFLLGKSFEPEFTLVKNHKSYNVALFANGNIGVFTKTNWEQNFRIFFRHEKQKFLATSYEGTNPFSFTQNFLYFSLSGGEIKLAFEENFSSSYQLDQKLRTDDELNIINLNGTTVLYDGEDCVHSSGLSGDNRKTRVSFAQCKVLFGAVGFKNINFAPQNTAKSGIYISSSSSSSFSAGECPVNEEKSGIVAYVVNDSKHCSIMKTYNLGENTFMKVFTNNLKNNVYITFINGKATHASEKKYFSIEGGNLKKGVITERDTFNLSADEEANEVELDSNIKLTKLSPETETPTFIVSVGETESYKILVSGAYFVLLDLIEKQLHARKKSGNEDILIWNELPAQNEVSKWIKDSSSMAAHLDSLIDSLAKTKEAVSEMPQKPFVPPQVPVKIITTVQPVEVEAASDDNPAFPYSATTATVEQGKKVANIQSDDSKNPSEEIDQIRKIILTLLKKKQEDQKCKSSVPALLNPIE
jgi:hypothetical protein